MSQVIVKRQQNLSLGERIRAFVLRRAAKFALGNQSRSYQAALFNRLTSDWTLSNTSSNTEIRGGLQALRARSRDLVRNESYATRYLQLLGTNVIGAQGIRFQAGAKFANGKADDILNSKVETAWSDWTKAKNADVAGKQSFVDLQWLFIRTLAQDGETLVRHINADNQYGFALQFLDADWLDESYDEVLINGHRVVMSVEEDRYGKALAYHLTTPADYYNYPTNQYDSRYRIRVPAAEMIHAFVVERPGQSRGVPWMAPTMMRLQTLGKYEEAELIAARVGASKMGFITRPADDDANDLIDEQGRAVPVLDYVQPGTIQQLPEGYDFKPFDPTSPSGNYAPFSKGVLRGVAAGIGVSYHSLANDLEAVNFSSIRAGLLEEREFWKELQTWTIDHFCTPVYEAWLKAQVGKLISISEYNRLLNPVWRPRGWGWVDPVKDVQADILAAKNRIRTRTEMAAERGRDYRDIIIETAAEEAFAKENGVKLVTDEAKPSAKPQSKPNLDPQEGDGNN